MVGYPVGQVPKLGVTVIGRGGGRIHIGSGWRAAALRYAPARSVYWPKSVRETCSLSSGDG